MILSLGRTLDLSEQEQDSSLQPRQQPREAAQTVEIPTATTYKHSRYQDSCTLTELVV